MAYERKEWYLKNTIEVEKSYTWKYGAPGQPRKKKKKATKEDIARQNEWNAIKKLRRLMNANFEQDDWHAILTYRKEERPTPEDAKKVLKKFMGAMRKDFKEIGQGFHYIVVTEWKNKAIHHHIIIRNIVIDQITTAKLIRKNWTRGRPKLVPLDDTGEYKSLAEYLIKETAKTFREPENPNKSRYSCSRNLIRPTPVVSTMKRKEIEDDPKPRKGYYIDKNSIREGVNPVTGYKYQHYTMIKVKRRE